MSFEEAYKKCAESADILQDTVEKLKALVLQSNENTVMAQEESETWRKMYVALKEMVSKSDNLTDCIKSMTQEVDPDAEIKYSW